MSLKPYLSAFRILLSLTLVLSFTRAASALNGSPVFAQPPTYASAGVSAISAAVGDLNGDGIPDMVVVNECVDSSCSVGSVGVLLGNGDGTFQPAQSFSSGGLYSYSVAVGDFNGDGKSDVVVANECQTSACSGGSVSVLLGNGDGTFQPAQSYASGGVYALSVAVGDFNGDGKSDVVVANECQTSACSGGSVGVLLGNGDGTFQPAQSYTSGGSATTSVAVGDFNGDGKPDVALANVCQTSACSSGGISVLLGNGDGTFQPPQSFASGGQNAYSVAVGDLNGDGKLDLAVGNQCQTSACNSGGISVLLGNGDGTFQPPQSYASGGVFVLSVALGDLNGDGKLDVVAGDRRSGDVSVLLGNGDGTVQAAQLYSSWNLYSAVVSDINGDGKADVLGVNLCQPGNCGSGSVSVMLGNADGSLQADRAFTSSGIGPNYLAVGDLNGDGKLDMVVADICLSSSNCNNNVVSVMLGNGDGTFQPGQTYSVGGAANSSSVNIADLDGDGKPDLLVTNKCSDSGCNHGSISVLLGNGNGTFQAAQSYSSGGRYGLIAAVADFNGDGKLDVAVSNDDDQTVGVLLGNGDGTFQPAQTYSSGAGLPQAIAVGDFNGDGKVDIVVANFGVVGILLGNGDGTFQPVVTYSFGSGYGNSVAVADFNGDGKADLVVSNSNGVGVLLGNGDGSFRPVQTYALGSNPALGAANSVVVGDFNGDGKADVIAAGQTATSILLGNGDGTFQTGIPYSPGGVFTTAGDLNGDQKPDVIVLQGGTAVVLLNIYPFPTTTILSSSPNPSSFGQLVTFTATVTSGAGALTGAVTFNDGNNSLGTGTLTNGTASLTTSALAVGGHSITAVYSGNNVGSTSAALTQTVQQAFTSTALASGANPSMSGSSVTFTATVTNGGYGIPTGTVTFMDGATTLGTGTLSGGVATYTTSGLAVGQHSMTAGYSGDADNAGSTSTAMTQTVNTADFTLTSNPTSSTVVAGQPGTFTLTVTPQGSFTSPINFSCSGLPNLAACAFNPTPLTPNTKTVTTTLTISTAIHAASLAPPTLGRRSIPLYAIGLVLPAMLLGTVRLAAPKRRKLLSYCLAFLLAGACLLQSACGGSGGGGTPAGAYTVTVTGGAGSTQHATILTLTVQ
jgi:hypothetical protein